ncbi:MAG TPA: EI24 domain-containing protein, partial [Archangium sp.]
MTTPIPSLQQTSAPGDVLRGLSIPFRAFKLLFATPRLRGLAIACAVVTGLTLSGVAFGAWRLADGLAGAILSGESGWQHAAAVGLSLVFFLVFFVVGALTVPNLLLAPLQDPI